jgi:hypothetical protein
MPSRGGQPSTVTATPAVRATSTAAMRPHMSLARSCFAKSQATSVGTAITSSVSSQRNQPSRHTGGSVAAGAATAVPVATATASAWAKRKLVNALLSMAMFVLFESGVVPGGPRRL